MKAKPLWWRCFQKFGMKNVIILCRCSLTWTFLGGTAQATVLGCRRSPSTSRSVTSTNLHSFFRWACYTALSLWKSLDMHMIVYNVTLDGPWSFLNRPAGVTVRVCDRHGQPSGGNQIWAEQFISSPKKIEVIELSRRECCLWNFLTPWLPKRQRELDLITWQG